MPWAESLPGDRCLLQGNAAMARGAIEAGVRFIAAYPGSPSSEIVEVLISRARVDPDPSFHVEWSVNEKVAFEAASAASLAGLRAMAVMKANGLNVCLDSVSSIALAGSRAGLVLIVCDDPAGLSSTNELDSRHQAGFLGIPLLEPHGWQSALDVVKEAFALSEACHLPVMVRSVTRISHGRGVVKLGEFSPGSRAADWSPESRIFTHPPLRAHANQIGRLATARAIAEKSPLNTLDLPEGAETLLITTGACTSYAREAVRILGLEDRVAVLGLATIWPLPVGLLRSLLHGVRQIGFLEEINPVLEEAVLALIGASSGDLHPLRVRGRWDGCVPCIGETHPEIALDLVIALHPEAAASRPPLPIRTSEPSLPGRSLAFCPGCPHKCSFLALSRAIAIDGRGVSVMGDIGCYSLAFGDAGFCTLDTVTVMGAGAGQACGLGQLARFGFDRPIIAVMGDSTFFHSGIAPLVNARYNGASFLFVLLDNCATAMTGFQPHPGIGHRATGEPTLALRPERVFEALDIPVRILDPFEVGQTVEAIVEELALPGLRTIILRRECALSKARAGRPYVGRAMVDPSVCLGEDCGCALFCVRTLACPALSFDPITRKSSVNATICSGCGACVSLCPSGALRLVSQGGAS